MYDCMVKGVHPSDAPVPRYTVHERVVEFQVKLFFVGGIYSCGRGIVRYLYHQKGCISDVFLDNKISHTI